MESWPNGLEMMRFSATNALMELKTQCRRKLECTRQELINSHNAAGTRRETNLP